MSGYDFRKGAQSLLDHYGKNGYAERLTGTLRREYLDRLVIFGEVHLRRVRSTYVAYYNQTRTHLALQKDAPLQRAVRRCDAIVAIPILAGCITNTPGYDFWKGQSCE
jgi:hypothetical protein